MKFTRIMALLLLLNSEIACADWIWTGIDDDKMTVYIDPSTLRRKGDRVKVWLLQDLKTENSKGTEILSVKAQKEYDCEEEQERTIAIMPYSGHMGSGSSVVPQRSLDRLPLHKWRPVVPGSVGRAFWELACSKK